MTHDEIKPVDSISNVSSGRHGSKAVSNKSNGMRSSFNKMETGAHAALNTDADSFVPHGYFNKCRTMACFIQGRRHHRASFPDTVGLIERQVKIAVDPAELSCIRN